MILILWTYWLLVLRCPICVDHCLFLTNILITWISFHPKNDERSEGIEFPLNLIFWQLHNLREFSNEVCVKNNEFSLNINWNLRVKITIIYCVGSEIVGVLKGCNRLSSCRSWWKTTGDLFICHWPAIWLFFNQRPLSLLQIKKNSVQCFVF